MTPVSKLPVDRSRVPLVQAVTGALEQFSGKAGSFLLTVWGSKGTGKTEFLERIVVDPAVKELIETSEILDIETLPIEQLQDLVRQAVSKAPDKKTVLIRIDNLDALLRKEDGRHFFEFERNSIQPALEHSRVLILATSQIEITQWREDDVRVRQANYRIPAMSFDEIAELVHNKNISLEKVYRLTLGQPQAAAWLRDDPSLSEEAIANKAYDFFLGDILPSALEIADVICLLPIFNPFLLQKIIKKENASENEADYIYSLERIREFIRQGMVYWDISVGAYRFSDSSVRRLLARRVLYKSPDLFAKVQNIASEYFQAEAKCPGYLHLHLVSAVYHLALTKKNAGEQEAGKCCSEWVKASLSSWMSARWEDVLHAWSTGADESAMVEEINDSIGTKYFKEITRQLETTKNTLEANQ